MVSVVIPNYNHSVFLKQRIDSVLAQTYQDFEVILLDDYSTDNSKEIIESYRSHEKVVSITFNQENSGSTFKQWKKGISLAKGDYIWIAESDDWCEPNFLEELIKLHETNNNIGLAYCKSVPVDSENQITDFNDGWLRRVDSKRWDFDFVNTGINECENYLAVQCTIPNASAVLFKKDVFNAQVPDLKFKVCGDWMTYIKILENYNIAYSSKPLNYHRSHEHNARTVYGKVVLEEQLDVMGYVSKNFKIHKTIVFYKSLNEKVAEFITLLNLGRLSLKQAKGIFKKFLLLDKFILFRVLKISAFKLLKMDVSFNYDK